MSAMVTAIVFIKADVAQIPEVAEAIAALTGVSEVYSVTGAIDLIAMVRVAQHAQLADDLHRAAVPAGRVGQHPADQRTDDDPADQRQPAAGAVPDEDRVE